MEAAQKWGNDINSAMDMARKSGKLILLFFHSNMCSGCQMTIKNTLPDKDVNRRMDERFMPVMFEMDDPKAKDLIKKYNVEWTPTFVVADADGNEIYRWVGYTPVEDFMVQTTMAEAKASMKDNRFENAATCFDKIQSHYPNSEAAPEAVYYKGVSIYKSTHDPSHLNKAYDELKSKYPNSDWTKKASVWSK